MCLTVCGLLGHARCHPVVSSASCGVGAGGGGGVANALGHCKVRFATGNRICEFADHHALPIEAYHRCRSVSNGSGLPQPPRD